MTDTELLLAEETARPARRPNFFRTLLRRPSALVSLLFLALVVIACLGAGIISPYSPFEQSLSDVYQGPSAAHPLGTDSLGRDLLSRMLHGGQTTLSGALVAVLVYGVLGVLIGIIAGTARARIDAVIMRFVDLMLSIPGLIVLLVVLAIFGSNEMAAMITLGVLSAPSLIRVVRGSTLSAKTELYVTAARVAGLTPSQVQWRHILPAISGPAITQVTLFAAAAILTEAGLGYLGLGVQPPQPNWGNLINDAQQAMLTSPWMLVPTGGILVLVSLALGMLGNAIRDSYMGRGARSDDSEQSWASMAARVERREGADALAADGALLSVRGLDVVLGDKRTIIVSQVDLDVAPGESVGIVGESGSGKTMFVTALLRMTPPGSTVSADLCRFDGRDLLALDEKGMNGVRGTGIAYITQESISSLDPVFTAGQQVAEAVRHHRKVSRREARRITLELFAMVRLPDPRAVAARYPHELSGGMAQRVCIARALAGQPRLLVADEPTTALDVTVQAEILDLLRDLRERTGMAMLIVTHDWGVLADSCDRALVMYRGQMVEAATVVDLVRRPQHPYSAALLAANPSEVEAGSRLPTVADIFPEAARSLGSTAPRPSEPAPAAGPTAATSSPEPLLRIEDLSVVYPGRGRRRAHPALEGVSIDVARGETVGVVGESGSGKSTTGNSVLGLTPITSGRILFGGEDITGLAATRRRNLSRRLQAIFQDPYSSLNPHRTVGQSITETLEADADDERSTRRGRAVAMLASVGLDEAAYDRYPGQFSGGQRQRISIARAMLPAPELIVCDEVVSALDLSVQAQVINLLVDLQKANGLSYLFITHDLSVVKHLCQRVVVLRNGKIVEEGPTDQVLNDPQTAYTKRLVLAAPVIDPDRQRERRLERLEAVTTTSPSLKGA